MAEQTTASQSSASSTPQVFLSSAQVRHRYGGRSQMALWRWLRDPAMGFPQPVYFGRLRFWRLDALQQWERAQGTKVSR
ncbi:MAG: transcriptional regulator [Alphaproteobacteria bacterium]|nr:transcriptional regulator [Alphaproteobacteria bacterium]